MSSASGKAKIPTISYDTGGLYGSLTLGKNGSYNPNAFQKNWVDSTSNGILNYTNQILNPSYDSETFKANQNLLNQSLNTSFENDVIKSLAQNNISRASATTDKANNFSNVAAYMQQEAINNEDTRNSEVLNQLINAYQIPFNMMTGSVSQAENTLSTLTNAQQNAQKNQAQLISSLMKTFS